MADPVPMPASGLEFPREVQPLADHHFRAIGEMVYHIAGINLHAGKEGLVRSRLAPRLRALRLASFEEYLEFIERDVSGAELAQMVDVLTTNKTSFFREAEHFRLLQSDVIPELIKRGGPLRFWSAGCSSGEEPFTLAIVLRELLPPLALTGTRILGTDISARMLAKARAAVYREDHLADVPPALVSRHFVRDRAAGTSRVADATRQLVRFARLNLMASWPMRGPFDVIFCRNVMIYFDRPTQQRIVQRFSELLSPGGMLFVGHSESLSPLEHSLRYVQPAVYVK